MWEVEITDVIVKFAIFCGIVCFRQNVVELFCVETGLILNLLFGGCLILGNLWFGTECSFRIKSFIYLFSRNFFAKA